MNSVLQSAERLGMLAETGWPIIRYSDPSNTAFSLNSSMPPAFAINLKQKIGCSHNWTTNPMIHDALVAQRTELLGMPNCPGSDFQQILQLSRPSSNDLLALNLLSFNRLINFKPLNCCDVV